MKEIRSYIFYVIAFMFIIFLSASFIGEDYVLNAYSVDLSPKYLYHALVGDLDEYLNQENTQNNPNLTAVYKLGDKNEQIKKYQSALYYLGFLNNAPSETFNQDFATAINKYQKDKGLTETKDILNKETMLKIDSEEISYKEGQSSEEILKYNLTLYFLGYLKQYPNNQFTSETKAALIKYQTDNGINASGTLNLETRRNLDSETIEYKEGQKGNEIKKYQTILKALGYLTGSADGSFGPATKKALIAYQSKNELDQTGTLNEATMTSLDRPINSQIKAK